MNVLFLDDNKDRWNRFRLELNKLFPETSPTVIRWTQTAEDCIRRLEQDHWQVVFLDHDLGGEVFVDTSREDCGMEVVRWIEQNKPENIEYFIVHSWNVPAAREMADRLKKIGYQTILKPFGL